MIKCIKYWNKMHKFSWKDRKISVVPHALSIPPMPVIFIWNPWVTRHTAARLTCYKYLDSTMGISIDYAASSTDNLQVCEILPNINHLCILYSWTWPFQAIISAVVYILWLWRFHIICCRNIKSVPGISNEMWWFSGATSQWKILHKNINTFFFILTPELQLIWSNFKYTLILKPKLQKYDTDNRNWVWKIV